MMLNNSYQPCITEPTRIINGNKPSLVDNIFSNSVEKCYSGNLLEKISDHLPNFVIYENVYNKRKPNNVKVAREETELLCSRLYDLDINCFILQWDLLR